VKINCCVLGNQYKSTECTTSMHRPKNVEIDQVLLGLGGWGGGIKSTSVRHYQNVDIRNAAFASTAPSPTSSLRNNKVLLELCPQQRSTQGKLTTKAVTPTTPPPLALFLLVKGNNCLIYKVMHTYGGVQVLDLIGWI